MVLDSADKKQFETTSLESVINNPKCTQCGSKTALITDPSSGERVCEYCGQVACEEDMQASLELLASSPKIRCLSKISPKLLGSLFTKKYPLPA